MNTKRAPDQYVEHLGRRGFHLEQRIGSGLSGSVYRATQSSLGRPVAIKFCDGFQAKSDPQLRRRFEREAKLLARMSHPGIPYVLVAGVVPGIDVPYTVMEFIEGRRLRDELLEHELEPGVAVRLTLDVLDALSGAHREKILHRDVCPENIMVCEGRGVLIDFSIGVQVGGAITRATNTGEHLGRADYMCPEQQLDMGAVDERCDVYAAAIVLLEMLTGATKLPAGEAEDFLAKFGPEFRQVVLKALAKDRDQRFSSAVAFKEALAPFESAGSRALMASTTAICISRTCSGADWTGWGYYRGPAVYQECVDTFCINCGAALKRGCDGCGAPFKNTSYCGRCGRRWYEIPTCKTCGSWLKLQDMGRDTATQCCSKGQRKAAAARQFPESSDDDDIPF